MVRTIKQFFVFLIFMLGSTLSLNAQNQEATLTVFGDGANKEEAIKVALRSAIEQAFGVFVSSNTKVINDELVKDEIATVASGNVKHFDVISEDYKDGKCFVSVSAIVSVGKLINYCKQQGLASEATIDAESFLMNQKIKELNEKNKKLAVQHLQEQIQMVYENACNGGVNFFDYQVEVGEPQGYGTGRFSIPCKVHIKLNDNFAIFNKSLLKLADDYRKIFKDINTESMKLSIHDNLKITNSLLNNIFSFELSDGNHSYTIKQLSYSDMINTKDLSYTHNFDGRIKWDNLKKGIGLVDGKAYEFNKDSIQKNINDVMNEELNKKLQSLSADEAQELLKNINEGNIPKELISLAEKSAFPQSTCDVRLAYSEGSADDFYNTYALLLNFFNDKYPFMRKFQNDKEMDLWVRLEYSEESFKRIKSIKVTPRMRTLKDSDGKNCAL